MFAAADVMATTVPQTVSGAKALLDVTIADAEADGVEARCLDSLKVLRQASIGSPRCRSSGPPKRRRRRRFVLLALRAERLRNRQLVEMLAR